MAVQSFREIVGAAPSRVSAKESALIVIDAQNEYANGKLKVANVDASRKVIANLLEHYRKSGGKIIHVVHQTPDGAPVFTPQTDLAKEFAELEPKDGEKVIQKHFPSSFADTELDQYLKSVDLKQIVLTGYMAHVCVSTTARDGARYGYDVVVVEDGIGDRDIPGASGEEVTKMTILELGDAFATVIPSKDIQ